MGTMSVIVMVMGMIAPPLFGGGSRPRGKL